MTKIKTGKVRFSYVHVFEPTAMEEGQTKKYNVAILIPKKDKVTVAAINKAVDEAFALGKTKHFDGKSPDKIKWAHPLYDGDEEKPDDEVYAGHYFLNAKSISKPTVLDRRTGERITDPEDFYSGCYGMATVNFYAYSTGKKGVAVGLGNILKTEDGDNLGGGRSLAEDDFADDLEDLM